MLTFSTAEERQDRNAKRRRIEKEMASNGASTGPSASLNLTAAPAAPSSLPARPDFAAKADSIGLGGPKTAETALYAPTAAQALAGSNRDVVANRAAIRLANMSAAEVLKAEMASLMPVKKASRSSSTSTPTITPTTAPKSPAIKSPSGPIAPPITSAVDVEIPGLGGLTSSAISEKSMSVEPNPPPAAEDGAQPEGDGAPAEAEDDSAMTDGTEPRGVKRSIEEADSEEAGNAEESSDEDAPADKPLALKVNPDGTVEQEDTVKCVLCPASLAWEIDC